MCCTRLQHDLLHFVSACSLRMVDATWCHNPSCAGMQPVNGHSHNKQGKDLHLAEHKAGPVAHIDGDGIIENGLHGQLGTLSHHHHSDTPLAAVRETGLCSPCMRQEWGQASAYWLQRDRWGKAKQGMLRDKCGLFKHAAHRCVGLGLPERLTERTASSLTTTTAT